ncbi:hypothetical protein [Sinorhizobium medicae]
MADETIEVRYRKVDGANGNGVYHKYIIYTDSNGDEYIARGGPDLPGAAGIIAGKLEGEHLLYTQSWLGKFEQRG